MTGNDERALESEGTRVVASWAVGRLLGGRFRLIHLIASGGMGTVWRARDESLQCDTAIKELRPELVEDPQGLQRLREEVKLAQQLRHAAIVRVNDLHQTADGSFIAMEYVPGGSLARRVRERGQLTPEEVQELGVQICAGLEEAHGLGVLHLDIKPDNILLTDEGRPKLADFGIAYSARETLRRVNVQGMGTLPYMAPEQLDGTGRPTVQTDVYQLGATLYECLTGRTPAIRDEPPSLDGTSGPVADAIIQALARDPARRPRDVASFATLLGAGVASRAAAPAAADPRTGNAISPPVGAMPLPGTGSRSVAGGPRKDAPRRRAVLLGAVGVGLVVLVVATGMFISSQRPAPQPPTESVSSSLPKPVPSPAPPPPPSKEVAAQPVSRPTPRGVAIRSEPPDAEIYVNWESRGRAPVTLDEGDRRGLVVAVKEGYRAAIRTLAPGDVSIALSLAPELRRQRTRLLLVVTDGVSADAASALRSRLAEEGLTVLGPEETRELQRESGRAGGSSGRAFRAWARARFDADLVVTARIRSATRDAGDQTAGTYSGLQDATRGIIRSEATVDLEALDLVSGTQVAASGKGSAFALDRAQSLQKALDPAVADAAKSLRERLRS